MKRIMRAQVGFIAFGLVVVAACAGEEAIVQTEGAIVDGPIIEGDDPSTDVVALSWAFNPGERRSDIPLHLESRLDVATDVTITAISTDGTDVPLMRQVQRVRVPAKAQRDFALRVDALPLQLVNGSVNTTFVASHVGPDGQTRHSVTPSLWITHQRDFGHADLRTARQEIEHNDTMDQEELQTRLMQREGRIADEQAGTDAFVALPDRRTARLGRATVARVPAALTSFQSSKDDEGQTVDKSVMQFCVRGAYLFTDGNMGEDFLNGNTWFPGLGFEPARFMNFGILKSDSTYLNIAYLDSNGCSPIWNVPPGNYTAYLMFMVKSGTKQIQVWHDAPHVSEAVTQAFTVAGNGVINLDMNTLNPLLNVSIASSVALHRQPTAFASGITTHVHVDEGCNGSTSACYDSSSRTIFLGFDHLGNSKALKKYNYLHELGHASMHQLTGTFAPTTYTAAVTQSLCQCGHVANPDSQAHCLQSREMIGAAQNEGWGHLLAADVLNNGSQASCMFNYYKEFKNANGTVVSPPVAKSCLSQPRWLENQCLASARGVEWDWLNFYWSLRNKGTAPYTYANLASVYVQACGTSCTEEEVSSSNLTNSADAVFGVNTPKASQWAITMSIFGVNH